jgi:hypothetical protein
MEILLVYVGIIKVRKNTRVGWKSDIKMSTEMIKSITVDGNCVGTDTEYGVE